METNMTDKIIDYSNLNLTQQEGAERQLVTRTLPFFTEARSFDEQETVEFMDTSYMILGDWNLVASRVAGIARGYGYTVQGEETLRRVS
jgi:hypothetical protein